MKRYFGIDLVRVLAVFFVLSVHFFLNNSFYDTNINGIGMFISIFLRWIFYNGVPLFILLTGYLKRKKKLDKDYYKGIKHILLSYLFISIICIIFRILFIKEHISKLKLLFGIFNFSANGYAWYLEMYIGLFLLIPFLNILYDGLKTKKNKEHLIITLLLMISLSPIISSITIRGIKLDIIPDWWNEIYPLIYYFIGCYINEYQVEINKKKGILLTIGLILIETILSYVVNYNDTFSWNFLGGYGSLQTVIISTTIFLLLYKVNCNKKKINKIITNISILSLDIYLFSYIVDQITYPILDGYLENPVEYLKFYILIIILIFSVSYLLSYIKKIIFDITEKKYIERKNKKSV
ncbi:MAG: hypothetical protein E7157_05140 [Lactobacillales bacterium]|nr:hypothetical protein [Lactobacillales bacterium]